MQTLVTLKYTTWGMQGTFACSCNGLVECVNITYKVVYRLLKLRAFLRRVLATSIWAYPFKFSCQSTPPPMLLLYIGMSTGLGSDRTMIWVDFARVAC